MSGDGDAVDTGTPEPTYLNNPVGTEWEPEEEILSLQEAVDRIEALHRRAQTDCYLPEYPEVNHKNAGRVRAFAQVLKLLRLAGLEAHDGVLYVDDDGVMQDD